MSAKNLTFKVFAVLVVMFVALPRGMANEELIPEDAVPGFYRVAPDDILKITVYDEDELSGSYRVDADGRISFPLIGQIEVTGLRGDQIEEQIGEDLKNGYLVDPSVSIEIEQRKPVYIMGEVRAPGSYPYASDMSVLNAVALAGGFTYRANEREVEVMRVGKGEEYQDMAVSAKIFPGDIIIVKESFF